jgi:hypothetical protein
MKNISIVEANFVFLFPQEVVALWMQECGIQPGAYYVYIIIWKDRSLRSGWSFPL